MAQIQAPYTFVTGDQVTAANLNAHTNSAILLPGSITDQPDIAANTVAANDSVALHDLSASTLKEATVGDLLNSGLNITTGAIAGKTGVDLVITPAAGQKVDVAGNIEADDVNVTDDLTVGDDATISGDLAVTGATTFTGNVIANGNLSVSGTANFVGGFQVGGSTGYILTEIVEQSFTFAGATTISTWTNAYTSASYTKPAGEIWMVEFDFRYRHEQAVFMAIRFNQTSTSTTLDGTFNIEGSGSNYFHVENCILRYVFQNASTFTSTFTLDFQPSASGSSVFVGEATFPYAGIFTGISMPASKFRIYKYKTL